jgi:hypothetical protein
MFDGGAPAQKAAFVQFVLAANGLIPDLLKGKAVSGIQSV